MLHDQSSKPLMYYKTNEIKAKSSSNKPPSNIQQQGITLEYLQDVHGG